MACARGRRSAPTTRCPMKVPSFHGAQTRRAARRSLRRLSPGLPRRASARLVIVAATVGIALSVAVGTPWSLTSTPAAAAAGTAVVPGSAISGWSQTSWVGNDDGSWPCGGGNASPSCPGPGGQTGPPLIPLGFDIDFYGAKYSSLYINNNGNVTFSAPLSQFTPSSLTSFGSPIIAPFFADVDTRGSSGVVNFGTGTLNGHKVFAVNWPGVGCFSENDSVSNNFQLILIDDPAAGTGPLGDDFEIEFNYNQIQWDTGTSSSGDS